MTRHAKPTLVVVDPDRSSQDATVRAWKRAFHVVTVSDGMAALDIMGATPPAAVFAASSLGDMDGSLFERLVRARTELCAVPVIFSLGWESRTRILQQLLAFNLLESLDDEGFSTLVRGVTALTRGTSSRRRPAARAQVVASAPAPSSATFDPEDGRAYLVKRLVIA